MRATATARRIFFAVMGFLALTALSTCTLTTDLNSLDDGQCVASGKKTCNGKCEAITDPQFGCAATGCVPCVLPNATAICKSGQCAVAGCVGTHEDCDRTASNGCEIDTDHDPLHCGGCTAAPCVTPNATPDCAAGHCAIKSCNTGFGDCDSSAADGCEANLQIDSLHCSKCSMPCGGGMACQSGQCR